ncbi:unnamed protein product [Pieris macdunnoughi]|uniref:Uncharacterized protein n=1 Tax=Pieris macdunnoughi TaxID=345717 RepID=A0A821XLD7_9NEOP|nr:unnamed protein product [Pieris macdunnoughi]
MHLFPASDAFDEIHEKCEKLMWKVIEIRKHYGKQCIEYQQKSSQCEMSLLKLRLNTISKLKSPTRRHEIPKLPYREMMQDMDDFKSEISTNERNIQNLMKKIKTTEDIAVHIKSDKINKLAKKPFTVNTFLLAAKGNIQDGS